MFKDSNIHFEISERTRAIGCGGIGALHKLTCKLGLDAAINRNVVLLKTHVPYWESDHVLNIAYNVLTGGTCLEDIERLRNDETYMNGLGADRIPDPTTAGDFLRQFDEVWIFGLQETFNETRRKVWSLQDGAFRKEAIIDVDGTVAETTGQCKEGMDIAYNGIWGYAPLIVTLANTNEVLYLVNRPGYRPSSDGAAVGQGRLGIPVPQRLLHGAAALSGFAEQVRISTGGAEARRDLSKHDHLPLPHEVVGPSLPIMGMQP